MNTQTVTVNLIPNLSSPAVVNVSQGDIGRPLAFKIMDGSSTATLTADSVVVQGTKPSGLGFSVSGTLSSTGSVVTVSTTEAMTDEAGKILTEIRFVNSGTVVATANFVLAVEASAHPDGTTDGTADTLADLETRVTALESSSSSGSGLTDDIKAALLQIAEKVAYIDANGSTYYSDLYDALYTSSTTYSVTYSLTNVTSNNTASSITSGSSYTATLTADTDYELDTVTVTMGGDDITSSAYTSGTISITSVTGDIVITATATASSDIPSEYTWLYQSSSGTLLSADTEKVDEVLTKGSPTEALSGSFLNIATDTSTSGSYLQYNLLPTTSTNAVLSAKVRCNALPSFVNTFVGLRLIISNGSSGATFAVNSSDIKYAEGSTYVSVDYPSGYDYTDWHIYKVELTSDGTQIGYIDDVQIFESSTLSSVYTAVNRFAFIASSTNLVDCDVAWVAYYDRS